jgi:hypothetical protein
MRKIIISQAPIFGAPAVFKEIYKFFLEIAVPPPQLMLA